MSLSFNNLFNDEIRYFDNIPNRTTKYETIEEKKKKPQLIKYYIRGETIGDMQF